MADITSSSLITDAQTVWNESDSETIKELKQSLADNESKIQTSQGPLQWLKAVNIFLEGVPTTISNAFNTFFKSGEKISQSGVDLICRWLAWKVNIAVERKRQQIIKSLYEQYGFMFAIQNKIMVVKNLISNPLSALGAIASAVKTILNFFFGPFAFVIQFMIDIFKEVAKLANNLKNIASALPPSPPSPNINFDAFKITIGKMGTNILTEDPSSMPTPEEMFPEPIRPFSSQYWKALGDEASQTYREEKPFYSMQESIKNVKDYNATIKATQQAKKNANSIADSNSSVA